MRHTIDFGIDLGTTNSAIARQIGQQASLYPGPDGDLVLPSAIHVAADGAVTVGSPARARFDDDPANTAIEFKRLMGTPEPRVFPASGRSMRAEELSAEVLKALLARVAARDGEAPRAAVVTIPAMFQLPQCEATRRAAQAAGIEHAVLLQEPVAAAIAHCGTGTLEDGYWLVYDLGGGTFDVSLVRSKGGRLQVLDHDGDNHLGGRDFDRAVVRHAAEVVRAEGKLGDFRRNDPALAEAWTLLKVEAERARIALSGGPSVEFHVPALATTERGERVGVRFTLERGEFVAMVDKLVRRTTELCNKVLARNQLAASELKTVVLVGGPTRTPWVLDRIEQDLGVRARHVIDPMHIVACGAALFAATQKLPSRAGRAPAADGAVELQLEYESMTTDPQPLLVARALDPSGVGALRVRRQDGGFESGWQPLNAKGGAAFELAVQEGRVNGFVVEARDRAGSPARCAPSEFTVMHGFSVARPPLSQSVGVMRSDGSMAWYIRKGAVLPARQKMKHTTTTALPRGQSGDAIHVPILQGEHANAAHNKVVGVLRIRAEAIARDLPAGSEVEVTLTIDESSHTTARAYVPLLDQWFDEVAFFELESKDAGAVKRDLDAQKSRLAELEKLADELDAATPGDRDERVAEIQALIDEGDRDAIDVADQLLRNMSSEMDVTFERNRAKELRDRFAAERDFGQQLLASPTPTAEERRLFDALGREFEREAARDDLDAAEQKLRDLSDLITRILMRIPEFWEATFDDLAQRFQRAPNPAATPLLAEGRGARARRDTFTLTTVCVKLMGLLPREQQRGLELLKVVSNVR